MKNPKPAVNRTRNRHRSLPRRARSQHRQSQREATEGEDQPPVPRRIRLGPALPPRRGSHSAPPARWEIVICGDLAEKQGELLDRLVNLPRRSPGVIWFDSSGGSAYAGLALASLIRLRGLRATAVVAGECSSAAILSFAACQRRFVARQATLLFHPVRWHSEENVRREEAAEWARHFQILERELDELLAEMLPMEPDALAAWTRPGRFVSGEEVVAAGLAERIELAGGDLWDQISRARPGASPRLTPKGGDGNQ